MWIQLENHLVILDTPGRCNYNFDYISILWVCLFISSCLFVGFLCLVFVSQINEWTKWMFTHSLLLYWQFWPATIQNFLHLAFCLKHLLYLAIYVCIPLIFGISSQLPLKFVCFDMLYSRRYFICCILTSTIRIYWLQLKNLITNKCKLVEGEILNSKKRSFIQPKIKTFV